MTDYEHKLSKYRKNMMKKQRENGLNSAHILCENKHVIRDIVTIKKKKEKKSVSAFDQISKQLLVLWPNAINREWSFPSELYLCQVSPMTT